MIDIEHNVVSLKLLFLNLRTIFSIRGGKVHILSILKPLFSQPQFFTDVWKCANICIFLPKISNLNKQKK